MAPTQKRARPPRIFGRFIWAHRVPPWRTAGKLAAIQMCANLARFKVGHRWKRATPPRVLEQFIRTKRSPREWGSRTQPRHQHGRACLVTEVWPPPRNARCPRAFSGDSFGPIEFPVAHCLRAGCHPNARAARAFPSGSPLETRDAPAHFGAVHSDKTIASRAGFSHAAPPPTREGLSRD